MFREEGHMLNLKCLFNGGCAECNSWELELQVWKSEDLAAIQIWETSASSITSQMSSLHICLLNLLWPHWPSCCVCVYVYVSHILYTIRTWYNVPVSSDTCMPCFFPPSDFYLHVLLVRSPIIILFITGSFQPLKLLYFWFWNLSPPTVLHVSIYPFIFLSSPHSVPLVDRCLFIYSHI